MKIVYEIFNNRELASILWVIIIVITLILYTRKKEGLSRLIQAFFYWKITLLILLAICYSTFTVYILWLVKFWDITLLKDSIFWFVVSGFVILLNLNKAGKEKKFFKNILLDNLKLILILEFVLNFHQFSLLTEFFILPVIVSLVILQVIAEREEKTKIVKTTIDWIFLLLATVFLIISIWNIKNDITGFANYSNLKSFLLPILLSISFIPFAYLIAVFMNYETVFNRLEIYLKNKKDLRYAKFRSILKCRFRVSKIRTLSFKISSLYDRSSREDIKNIIS